MLFKDSFNRLKLLELVEKVGNREKVGDVACEKTLVGNFDRTAKGVGNCGNAHCKGLWLFFVDA